MTYLTLRQAAAYLGYSYEHTRRLAKAGDLPCKRLLLSKDDEEERKKKRKQPTYKFVKEKLDELMGQDLPRVDVRTLKIMGGKS